MVNSRLERMMGFANVRRGGRGIEMCGKELKVIKIDQK